MTDILTKIDAAREQYDGTRSTLRAERENARVLSAALDEARAEIVRLRAERERRTLTIDLATGRWLSDLPITGEEGARVAASVLPGTTPEQVGKWYSDWMSDDAEPPVNVPDLPVEEHSAPANVTQSAEFDREAQKWVCSKCAREIARGHDDGQIPEHHRTCLKRHSGTPAESDREALASAAYGEAQSRYMGPRMHVGTATDREIAAFIQGAHFSAGWRPRGQITDEVVSASRRAIHRAIAPNWMGIFDALGGSQDEYEAFLNEVATAALEAGEAAR